MSNDKVKSYVVRKKPRDLCVRPDSLIIQRRNRKYKPLANVLDPESTWKETTTHLILIYTIDYF